MPRHPLPLRCPTSHAGYRHRAGDRLDTFWLLDVSFHQGGQYTSAMRKIRSGDMSLIVARAYRQIIHTDLIPNCTRPRRIAGERFQWIIEERKRRRSAEVQASAGAYNEWRQVGYFVTLEHLVHALTSLQLRAGPATRPGFGPVRLTIVGTPPGKTDGLFEGSAVQPLKLSA